MTTSAAIARGDLSARRDALKELVHDTPELVVDLPTVERNIARAAALAREAGKTLRPHLKTHKLPEIAALQLSAGAAGVQVAKLGEAEVMVEAGFDDVLIGYPIVGEAKLERLIALASRATLSVSLDSLEVAIPIALAAKAAGVELGVLLELDTGLERIGIQPGPRAADLAEQLGELPALHFVGVLTHEGHVYTAPGDVTTRRALALEACALLVETADAIRARGIDVPTVSAGSSATFRHILEAPGVTEVRPGTYVFNDRTQVAQGAATDADVGAFIATTVVSHPASDRVVVDAGSKVLSSDRMIIWDAPDTFGEVAGHQDWTIARLSEEHAVVEVPPTAKLNVGDRLLIIPNHICPAVNLASWVSIVDEENEVRRLPVLARGKVQ
jgi:D-serine deaminase-like pyridoxal phosphate-dependent protein